MDEDEMIFEIFKRGERDVAKATTSVVIFFPVLMVKCASDKTTVTYETDECLRDSMGLFQMFLHVLWRKQINERMNE